MNFKVNNVEFKHLDGNLFWVDKKEFKTLNFQNGPETIWRLFRKDEDNKPVRVRIKEMHSNTENLDVALLIETDFDVGYMVDRVGPKGERQTIGIREIDDEDYFAICYPFENNIVRFFNRKKELVYHLDWDTFFDEVKNRFLNK